MEATRPVRSAYGRKAPNRYGRRPTPWPDVNPDPQSLNRMLRRHKVNNATQSSEEGDVFDVAARVHDAAGVDAHHLSFGQDVSGH